MDWGLTKVNWWKNNLVGKKNKITVLHDWDEPVHGGLWYLITGIKYILYSICKFLGFPFLMKEIAEEPKKNAMLIAMVNRIAGVHGIFGIREHVKNAYPETVKELDKMGMEIRRHIHIGERPDPNRKRLWEPSLNQSSRTWNYDVNYILGKKIILKKNELPIWHVNEDSLKNFEDYIVFLYNVLILREDIY